MARKYENIENKIKSSEQPFYRFLHDALEGEMFDFLINLSSHTNVYIFSGIIRNYFLHNYLVRDVDVIVDSDETVRQLLGNHKYIINSFGGYKLKLGKKNLDLWRIDNTWGLKRVPKMFDVDLQTFIPSTAFFNFSSIIYSINDKQFIYTEDFLSFLHSKTLDYVFSPNLNQELCIVNTVYYSEKYKLKIGNRLLKLIRAWHLEGGRDYKQVQLKHFGEVLFSNQKIDSMLNSRKKVDNNYVK
ncbi:hypothetical protein SAMN05421640_1042 [Ekhidna lutea]|uniref:Poly A polymerase head domain-containing protein n=1 Tax=Ekhidna lutea TaxID=447679 RepID=A0A239GXQ7_EKHLU|nr:hypothetical protein [Ekhidna lutea]SNS73558.1 hypothetical protein SAMN05421640_1042 [Ekhidna lutea]